MAKKSSCVGVGVRGGRGPRRALRAMMLELLDIKLNIEHQNDNFVLTVKFERGFLAQWLLKK